MVTTFEDLSLNSHLWSVGDEGKKEYTIEEFPTQTYTAGMYRRIVIKDITTSKIDHFWIPPNVSSINPNRYFSLATSLEEAKKSYVVFLESEIEKRKKEITRIQAI